MGDFERGVELSGASRMALSLWVFSPTGGQVGRYVLEWVVVMDRQPCFVSGLNPINVDRISYYHIFTVVLGRECENVESGEPQ